MKKQISKATIVRTCCLLLAIVNSILQRKGYSLLPIDDMELEQIITDIMLYGTAIVNWWKDNDITQKALERKAKS